MTRQRKKNVSKKEYIIPEEDKLTEEKIKELKVEMNPKAIPDLDNLLEIIYEMISFIETPKMKKLENTNIDEFERLLFGRYNSKVPMKIIRLMCDENRYDNLMKLIDMFDVLQDIKSGKKDMINEHNKFCESLNEKYLYSAFGGRENFEKEMQKELDKKK